MDVQDSVAVWFILDKIQIDLAKINDKWEANLVTTTRLTENMAALTDGTLAMKGLLTDIRSEIGIVQKHLGIKSKKELRVERWKAIGKVAGVGALVLPGIISFLSHFL